MKQFLIIFFLSSLALGCSRNDTNPKPKAYLSLNFPPQHYKTIKNCNYKFKINQISKISQPFKKEPCQINIDYKDMKGVIYITYKPVIGNLEELIKDAQQLPLEHTIKADEIKGDEYENPSHKTYGMLYTVTGDAASQTQFYLTDSTHHFITGSVYFKRRPNYDSIFPAAEYLKTDVIKLVESLEWVNEE